MPTIKTKLFNCTYAYGVTSRGGRPVKGSIELYAKNVDDLMAQLSDRFSPVWVDDNMNRIDSSVPAPIYGDRLAKNKRKSGVVGYTVTWTDWSAVKAAARAKHKSIWYIDPLSYQRRLTVRLNDGLV